MNTIKPVVVLTGGGSSGHVTPNIALIPALKAADCQVEYIGSVDGVEQQMISSLQIPYHAVRSGKLRRYFSWQNVVDPFYVLIGIIQSFFLLRRLKASVVFSKGGFVALPVVLGAWLNRIPVIAHESDLTPGLANRLSFPFVKRICVTFAAAKDQFKQPEKVVVTGTPIRSYLLNGDKASGLARCGFREHKPCLLVMGGGQGATAINTCIRGMLDDLCEQYQVIHLCGRNKIDKKQLDRPDYYQLDYADEDLADLFAASDLVISRSGANSLYEILVLAKPHILIPLSKRQSRGDQIENARYFEKQGISVVLEEDMLSPERLQTALVALSAQKEAVIDKIKALKIEPATDRIVALVLDFVKK